MSNCAGGAGPRPKHLVAVLSPSHSPSRLPSNLPPSPLSLSFPPPPAPSLCMVLSGSDEEVQAQFRGRLGVPQRVPSKAPFPPRHKVSCILKHTIVSARCSCTPLSKEQPCVRLLCVCCMYAFWSASAFWPRCVNVLRWCTEPHDCLQLKKDVLFSCCCCFSSVFISESVRIVVSIVSVRTNDRQLKTSVVVIFHTEAINGVLSRRNFGSII